MGRMHSRSLRPPASSRRGSTAGGIAGGLFELKSTTNNFLCCSNSSRGVREKNKEQQQRKSNKGPNRHNYAPQFSHKMRRSTHRGGAGVLLFFWVLLGSSGVPSSGALLVSLIQKNVEENPEEPLRRRHHISPPYKKLRLDGTPLVDEEQQTTRANTHKQASRGIHLQLHRHVHRLLHLCVERKFNSLTGPIVTHSASYSHCPYSSAHASTPPLPLPSSSCATAFARRFSDALASMSLMFSCAFS